MPNNNTKHTPVRVRMYRQGLGDCFLITFNPEGDAVHMLIDCGSLGATTTRVKLSDVVKDICDTTGGNLDLLVATHEHKDHVSAFKDFREIISEKLKVKHVWLAWTENPEDKLAQKIARPHDLAMTLIHASRALVQAKETRSAKLGQAIRDIIGFAGDAHALGADDFAETVDEAMDFVRHELAGAKTEFYKPGGAPLEPSWIPGFRFYVLGPPYSEEALQDTGEKGSSELYSLAAHLKSAAVRAADPQQDCEEADRDMPFDPRFRLQEEDPLIASALEDYKRKENSWRRIDYDWLHSAADLALQLDNLTNNTSLALAIERISDRKVFLFPADAQEGNWLSWHDPQMKWQVKEGELTREVTAEDLLNRTVLYKVGHHGSHNATAKAKGLELMKRRNELVAFIPVDRAVALKRNPKNSWRMPARPLYLRLLQKCRGRVLRSDIGWAADSKTAADRTVEQEFDGMADKKTWTRWKNAQARMNLNTSNPLYFELTFQ